MPIAKYKKDKSSDLYYTYEKTGLLLSNGKPEYKKLRAKTIAALDQKVKEYRGKAAFGISESKITVDEWYDKWFDSYKSGCRQSTRDYYRFSYLNHIKPAIGAMRLDSVREHNAQKILNSLAETHSVSTVKGVRTVLYSLFDKAKRNNLILVNPAEKLKLTGKPKKERRELTEDERAAYLLCCKIEPFGTFAAFLYFFGLRRGEALALTAEDIKDGYLTVNKQFTYPSNNQAVLSQPKTKAGIRKIPIPDKARKYIDFNGFGPGLLFSNADGSPLSYSQMIDRWKAFITAALGEDTEITMHCLRHNYCTMLFENGVDILTAKECMGHDDIETTMKVYAHFSENIKRKNIERIVNIG